MIRKRVAAQEQPAGPAGLHGSRGAIVAGGGVSNSVAQHIEAQQAFVLSPEAHGPIPADAAGRGVSNIPSGAVGGFVGRTTELTVLDEMFTGPGEVLVQAVHGLGGVGKSALAARWAAGRHETVRWWITADSEPAVHAGVAALARALQPGLAGLPVDVQSERAVRWLADHPDRWLLVLDNVEAPLHIRPLLDRVPGGRVLVTTRLASGWHRHAATVPLGVLEPADAVELFTRILSQHGPREHTGADAVCAELGHLALAIEQAAAYCAETGTTPLTYLDRLRAWPATMYAAAAEGGDSARTCARIWRLTLDHVDATPLAGDLLRLLAWYAPDRIPRDLFDPLATPPEVDAAIGRLVAHNMITDNHDGTLTVHRLVQSLARTPDPEDPHRQADDIDEARDDAAELLARAYPADPDHPANWPRYRALLPHTEALAGHHPADQDTLYTSHALDRAATYARGQGAPALTVPTFQRALAARERVLGQDHPSTLSSRNNLAGAYEYAGDLGRAIPLYEATVADFVRVLGPDHPDTLAARNNLAGAYESAGDSGRAVPLHEATVADYERVLGPDHPDTLAARNNLAGAYESAGDPDRATPLYESTLAARERVLGPDHPDTLSSRNNLASTYESAGDLDRAVPLYEAILATRERVMGPDHPHTLSSRNNLAGAYESAGDLGRATPLYEATLADAERVLGHDHPDTLTARNNLAYAYGAAGDVDRAFPLYEATLATRERVLGPDHPDTLSSRNNLAGAYEALGDLGRAVPLYEATLATRERVLGPDHPSTLSSRNNLAGAYQSTGDLDRAVPLYEATLATRERVLGPDHPHTLSSCSNLAGACMEAGDLDRALALCEATLATQERVLGHDHPHTLTSRNNLAGAYVFAGDLDRAIPLFEATLAARERVLGYHHPHTHASRINLASVFLGGTLPRDD
ncbi:tetratricopeptide repeat protein [Streptomyces showdoensis]|uniref:tetratricopeptide repeat protein n=1 Tax=Streptomyces showdoensis TaxID=68268 RepID=UPI001969A645|nr:tetratricopeptide repeat protein [Streptomyces showdoensis]